MAAGVGGFVTHICGADVIIVARTARRTKATSRRGRAVLHAVVGRGAAKSTDFGAIAEKSVAARIRLRQTAVCRRAS
jgi:hypothetical protein